MWQFYIYVGIYSPQTTNSSDAPTETAVVKCNLFLLNLNEKINVSSTELITKQNITQSLNEILFTVLLITGKERLQWKYCKSV